MPSLRQIRLATGLVLYVYVTLHFANHALGNISIGAMESGLAIQKLIWQSPPGAVILYAFASDPYEPRLLGALRAAPIPLDSNSRRPNLSSASPFHSC